MVPLKVAESVAGAGNVEAAERVASAQHSECAESVYCSEGNEIDSAESFIKAAKHEYSNVIF